MLAGISNWRPCILGSLYDTTHTDVINTYKYFYLSSMGRGERLFTLNVIVRNLSQLWRCTLESSSLSPVQLLLCKATWFLLAYWYSAWAQSICTKLGEVSYSAVWIQMVKNVIQVHGINRKASLYIESVFSSFVFIALHDVFSVICYLLYCSVRGIWKILQHIQLVRSSLSLIATFSLGLLP